MNVNALSKAEEKMREDYLREIVNNMFTYDKDNWIVQCYGPDSILKRDINKIESNELFVIASKYYINKIIGTTKCDNPNDIIANVVDYLNIIDAYTSDMMTSEDVSQDDTIIEKRKNRMREVFEVNDEYDDSLIQLLSYNMIRCGLTDFESDIRYSWITNNGRACLYVLRTYLNKLESDEDRKE